MLKSPFDYKIATAAHLAERITSFRGVSLTTGCFDILHYGHMSLINDIEYRWPRNIVVVGINSDESVRRLKGLSRPIIPQSVRAEMVASLDAVSYVCIFDESTPEELIEKIKPKIFVKGGDYTIDDLPEAAAVRRNGGEVYILPLVPGWSTTDLVRRIKLIG
jgi:rfaE bifunctional protein nucleotidyltransferase chain/domain